MSTCFLAKCGALQRAPSGKIHEKTKPSLHALSQPRPSGPVCSNFTLCFTSATSSTSLDHHHCLAWATRCLHTVFHSLVYLLPLAASTLHVQCHPPQAGVEKTRTAPRKRSLSLHSAGSLCPCFLCDSVLAAGLLCRGDSLQLQVSTPKPLL